MKKIPPYSKPLQELQQKGQRPSNSVYVWIGNNAWKKGQNFSISMPNRTIIIPAWQPPTDYLYPVNQCDVLIFDTGYAEMGYIEALVFCLYQDGADIVRCYLSDHKLTVYHKEV